MLDKSAQVDFGLAKPYIDCETKKHISYAERRSIIGEVTTKKVLTKWRCKEQIDVDCGDDNSLNIQQKVLFSPKKRGN